MYEIFTILRIISRVRREKTLFLETTDGVAARATDVVRWIDVATVVEVQAVRGVAIRRGRPIEAGATDIAQTAIAAVAITRSRVPDGRCAAELAGEVHTFFGTVVSVDKRR